MQIKGKYSWAKHLDFMIIDLVSLLIAFFISYFMKFGTLALSEEWTRLILIIFLLNIVLALVIQPYSGIFKRRYYLEIGRSVLLVSGNALGAATFFYILKVGEAYSREVFIFTYIFYFLIATLLKYIWKQLLMHGKVSVSTSKKMSLFIISESSQAGRVIHNTEASDLSVYDIKGIHFVDSVDEGIELFSLDKKKIPIVGDGFVKYILDNNISEVLIAVPANTLDSKVYETLISNGVGVDMVVESTLGFQTEEQYITNIGVYKALSIGSFTFSPTQSFYLLVKRIVDIICGFIGLVFLLPIMLVVKLVNLCSGDTAKLFYRQKRVGQNGKIIKIWKFRSMVPDADKILEEMLKEEKWRKQWEENQKFDNDPRITKAGKFLRKTSIDELPQLLNVLIGDMSLVGPRPLVEGELEAHDGLKIYQKVKPGITGWWGCNGRSNIDYRERLELEYYYVKNCSFYLDILCILRTVLAVLKKDGAQ